MPALKSAENSRADICFNSFLGGTDILFRAASLSLVSGRTSIVALRSSAFVIRFRLGNGRRYWIALREFNRRGRKDRFDLALQDFLRGLGFDHAPRLEPKSEAE